MSETNEQLAERIEFLANMRDCEAGIDPAKEQETPTDDTWHENGTRGDRAVGAGEPEATADRQGARPADSGGASGDHTSQAKQDAARVSGRDQRSLASPAEIAGLLKEAQLIREAPDGYVHVLGALVSDLASALRASETARQADAEAWKLWLKDDETLTEGMQGEHRDNQALLGLLAKEKADTAALRAASAEVIGTNIDLSKRLWDEQAARQELQNAAKQDDHRLRQAAALAGVLYVGCDTPEALAEAVLIERKLRQEAEQERDSLRHLNSGLIYRAERAEAALAQREQESAMLKAGGTTP